MLDYHVHLFSHDEHAIDERVSVAYLAQLCRIATKRNVAEIAITEHLFRFSQAKPFFTEIVNNISDKSQREFMYEYYNFHATLDLDHYIETLQNAKKVNLPLIIGLEMDFLPNQMDTLEDFLSSYPFDIVLGSVHFIRGHMFDVLDSPLQMGIWEKEGTEKVFSDYLEVLQALIDAEVCDVLAHIDLVKVAGRKLSERGFSDFESEIIKMLLKKQSTYLIKDILLEESSLSNRLELSGGSENGHSDMVVEFSSAGLRKPAEDTYPNKSLLAQLYSFGVGITFASDAHEPMSIAYRFPNLKSIAREVGYSHIRRFLDRKSYSVDIDEGAR